MNDLYKEQTEDEGDDRPTDPQERLRSINEPLLAWYRENARDLPWRRDPSAYRVWISEIMLQQTRVEAAKPYFDRFVEELPDVHSLALAQEERVMKLWEGLGYYSRARNLQKAAKMIEEEYGGQIPDRFEDLCRLPGIGSYTAGAVASIAYGKKRPAVDGNVLRVLSRILADDQDVNRPEAKRKAETLLLSTMPDQECGSFNQALFEIGALICVPNGRPRCGDCPVCSLCLAHRQGREEELPVRTSPKPRRIEEKTVFLIRADGRTAIRKRPDQGLLASLYEFPAADGHLSEEEARRFFDGHFGGEIRAIKYAGKVRHIFSHIEWNMIGYLVETDRIPAGFMPAEPGELSGKYPLPGAFSRYISFLTGKS